MEIVDALSFVCVVCVCACVRACVRARAGGRACVRPCECVYNYFPPEYSICVALAIVLGNGFKDDDANYIVQMLTVCIVKAFRRSKFIRFTFKERGSNIIND